MSKTVNDISEQLAELGILQLGDVSLEKISSAVDFKHNDVVGLSNQLFTVLENVAKLYDFRNGIGISAPQLGIMKRAIVFGESIDNLIFLANPQIVKASTEYHEGYEGCLSFWQTRGLVQRAKYITVSGYDCLGTRKVMQLTGITSRICQHECDHLNGILYTQRISEKNKIINLDEYGKFRDLSSNRQPTLGE